MKRSTARLVHLSTLGIVLTGAAWAWMAYLWTPGAEPDDLELLLEWTGVHEWLPATRTLHLFAAPVAVFAVGAIWFTHVAPRLFKPWKRRLTGTVLALLMGPMVLSGIALQTAASPEARELWVWVHGVSSAVWTAAYLGHLLMPRRSRPQASAPDQ